MRATGLPAALRLTGFSGGVAGRHAALVDFCAKHLNAAPDRLTLAHDDFGAPILQFDGAPSPWRISLASRENVALFGLSRERIGVDLEVWASIEPAWNILHAKEKVALTALPADRRGEEFLRLWTAKEAYLKALGVGLRREPEEIFVEPQGETFRLSDRERDVALNEARLWRERIGRRAVLCACVTLPGK